MIDQADMNATEKQPMIDRRLFVKLDDLFNATATCSVNLRNHFTRNKITYVGDMYKRSFSLKCAPTVYLMAIPQFSLKRRREMTEIFKNIGLSLDALPHGTELWSTLSQDQIEASPVLENELQQMLRTDAADAASSAPAQPATDRRLLVKIDDLLQFNRYGQNGGALGRNLAAAGAIYIGDVLSKDFPETVNPAAKERFAAMLANIGLNLKTAISSEAWAAANPAAQPPVDYDELVSIRRTEILRQSQEEERRIEDDRMRREAKEAARLQGIQATFTEAQRVLLQPQSVEIDDPDVTAFQAKIPGGVLLESDLRDADRANTSKLTKLAIALATLEGERPDFLFVTSVGEHGVVNVTGVIGTLTDENRAVVGLIKREGLGTATKNYERFGPAFPAYGDDQKYFLVREPKCLARIGIVPQKPTIKIKAAVPAGDEPL